MINQFKDDGIVVEYWDDVHAFRYVPKKVDRQMYEQLWNAKKLDVPARRQTQAQSLSRPRIRWCVRA